jgi:starch synthase
MHILFATSEAAPFSKTGGLADVCGALPKALSQLGHKATIVTPLYKCVREYFERSGERLTPLRDVALDVRVGNVVKGAGVRHAKLAGSEVDVYFIEHDDYFYRDGLYNYQGVDYGDNCERYSFFCRAVLELIAALELDVDVLHANDWQTGLLPVFLEASYKSRSRFSNEPSSYFGVRPRLADPEVPANRFDKIKSVLTLHNMRHQGRFWRGAMELTGLDWSYFSYDKMEFYGQLNLLKSGIVFSDAITTVSPSYAQEIQTEAFGEKLQGVLQNRAADLTGILNGVDVDDWNPATDRFIAANYDVDTVLENKPKCKAAFQEMLGLPVEARTPLFGVVSRFDEQKGLDLIADLAGEFIEKENVQFAILGSGDRALTDRFMGLAARYPRNFAVRATFSVELSHQIEAGSDVFLMPSRYEPCGLNQMYSLRYGTLPLVRDVGGLRDSVVNASDENIDAGIADGFIFYWGTPEDMAKAMHWALHCYRRRPNDWAKMMKTAMSLDLSWKQSARKYAELYEKLIG